ncbi:hypothetical protein A4F89_02115 [Polynucleobacter asymbioticus]|uniref:Sulfotransferase domain-containing protein n=2 Tax=Polynucleobacter asymbioticus TaxID=576611 RepID=A0AAC9ITA2_9BURK|nr:hypothetical protein A4F89_02115 [Polynucleobacter asymbioticus]APC00502.1 hypothetical protein AOC25_02120 [Polynucleobacter asymbioticus]
MIPVSPDDFSCHQSIPLSEVNLHLYKSIVPYCVDFRNRENCYIGNVDIPKSLDAPFLYQYLRETATSFIKVPWENGPIFPDLSKLQMPRFIFSPGRCGSTLAGKIVLTAGGVSLSEPDYYSQISLAKLSSKDVAEEERRKFEALMRKISLDMTIDLLHAYQINSSQILIKLRSECCLNPKIFLFSKTRKQDTIFIIRHFKRWAISFASMFAENNKMEWIENNSVNIYQHAINCFAFLKSHSKVHVITYETMTNTDLANASNLSRAFNLRINPEAIKIAASEDSQKGTVLERRTHHPSSDELKRIDQAFLRWRKNTQGNFLIDNGLGYLLDADLHSQP